MSVKVIEAVRASSPNLKNSIVRSLQVDKFARSVEINIITDLAFTNTDAESVRAALRQFVPESFTYTVNISKLSPDCEMVARKIVEAINVNFKAVAVTLKEGDVTVEKTDGGFRYTVAVMPFMISSVDINKITAYLNQNFCGNFYGKCIASNRSAEELKIEEKPDEIEFEIPVRKFQIENFEFLEGTKIQNAAVYLADLNFAADEVVICGTIEEIRERSYTTKKNAERKMLSILISDSTASVYATYFIRQKSYDKIKNLKAGDSIVCTGTNEEFRGSLKYTAKTIDFGRPPKGFVPEKRASKPVPAYYHYVKPQQFTDAEQTDFLTKSVIPECLKGKSFVVFDLETTGLNSSPVAGNMDRIIEIGAYKIEDGSISQYFSTFVNPQRKLSEEIMRLTGINEAMVADAPTYEQVMPDFFKFCSGSILVGHNVAGFDFKFVDYYCARLGYILERKIIDTIPLSQELLIGLSNYKLNTIADKFGITFNHHRAVDDALATAKIFIELIKLKKSLPKL